MPRWRIVHLPRSRAFDHLLLALERAGFSFLLGSRRYSYALDTEHRK